MLLALILTVLTAISAVGVLFDKFYYKQAVEQHNRVLDVFVEYSRSFLPVLAFVLIVRSFIFEPFRIPSGSMMPTLYKGDFIFVKKYSYGLRLPVIEKKIIETGMPERGDVIVFRLPSNPNINYIKRVVGLPGDTLVHRNHQLVINGQPVLLERDRETPLEPDQIDSGSSLPPAMIPRWIETLDDREHSILIRLPQSTRGDGTYVVPEGSYFVMGDNRDNSQDSRVIGVIPEEFLVGEASRIWMHADFSDGLEWPDWGRIGTKIQ